MHVAKLKPLRSWSQLNKRHKIAKRQIDIKYLRFEIFLILDIPDIIDIRYLEIRYSNNNEIRLKIYIENLE